MSETSKIRMNKIYRFVQICLQLADIADQKKETPFHDELSMGCMAFSGYMRQGVKEIIDLKQDYFSTLSRMELAEESEKDARDFLKECFGDSEIDSINDADKERIIALCKQIESEWEGEGMTEREAIEKLEHKSKLICLDCIHPSMVGWCENYCQLPEAFNMAISALEKQEKKPAKAKFNKRYNKFVYFCPVCGEVTGYYDYCSDCGQAIDYDNPDPYTEEES